MVLCQGGSSQQIPDHLSLKGLQLGWVVLLTQLGSPGSGPGCRGFSAAWAGILWSLLLQRGAWVALGVTAGREGRETEH